jgi:BMFP domain-containing protein YqiC
MLPIVDLQPVFKVQVPCQPFTQPEEAAAARKKAWPDLERPKLGRSDWSRNKTGQSAVILLGEPSVEIPKVEELLRSLMQGLPPGLVSGASGLREDLENNFRAVLRANLGKLDLAGRDEFDAQRKVLERTRERLEALEQRVAELETSASKSAGR